MGLEKNIEEGMQHNLGGENTRLFKYILEYEGYAQYTKHFE